MSTTIGDIAQEICFEKGENLNRYELYVHYGLECLRDLQLDILREVKAKALEQTEWSSIRLPEDLLDLIRVGVVKEKQVLTFTNNDYISLIKDSEDCVEIDTLPTSRQPIPRHSDQVIYGSSSLTAFSNYYNEYGELKGRLFGLPNNDNGLGEFRWDRNKNEVFLSIGSALEDARIYIEYIGLCDEPTEATPVNPVVKKAVKYYVDYKVADRDPNVPANEKIRLEDQYWREFKRSNSRLHPLSVAEIIEATRQYYMQVPKG